VRDDHQVIFSDRAARHERSPAVVLPADETIRSALIGRHELSLFRHELSLSVRVRGLP